ncbi:MAG TPA: gamma-glutamyl-gamma-aminobutyrate hydrolase family protein, partial [Candidatus Methylacidiphilales bacterium]
AWPADEEPAGLLLTGGSDVSIPFLRQPVPDPALVQEPDPERDAWEWAATERALELRLPILAICRGVQVLNVVLGGTLHLDIPGHNLPEQKNGNVQPLAYADGVEAALRFPAVNSSHHQALDRLGEGLVVEARHAGDGTIEQVRLAGHPFAIGVQYHPERDPALYRPLFEAFATAAGG